MTAPNDHGTIRSLLALAVAGALEAEEQRRLEQHVAACPECAAELAGWQGLAGSLRRMPTPQAPAALVERTLASIEAQWVVQAERRWNQQLMVFLVLFAWTITLATWPIVRLASRGVASWLDVPYARTWTDLVFYTVLVWLTAGVAAAVLAVRQRRERRLA